MRDAMNTLIVIAPALAVAVVALGIAAYLVILGLAAFGSKEPNSMAGRLRTWVVSAGAQNIGLPAAAMAAFAVVATLLRAFPPTDANGQLSLRAFGLEFTGPSGPITLWLICFMVIVIALRLLRG
jgi:hypothetical protein